MRKICTRKALFFIFFLNIFPAFLTPISANAATYAISTTTKTCNWTPLMTPFSKSSPTTGGCTAAQVRSDDIKCTGAKPAGSSNLTVMTSYICCCTAAATPEKTSLFTIPDFQVKIPGLDKLATITCPVGQECNIPWIGQYISGIYNYALAIVGIIAAIVLMAGGLMWLISAGDASKITQAKELIVGSISGLVILVASYALLYTINPDLVNLGGVSIVSIERQDIVPSPENSAEFSSQCKPVNTGNCAVSKMSGFGAKASEASGICMAESGGRANIHNNLTKCDGGEYAVWGLFQFNLSANNFIDENGHTLYCSQAFNKPWTNSSRSCKVTNQNLYNACVKAATNPQLSILNAQKLVSARNWGPWETNSKLCHF